MLVGDSSIEIESPGANEVELDLLKDEDKLVVSDSKDEDEDAEKADDLVLVGEDSFNSVEGVSLDEDLKLASDSWSSFHFLFHSELRLNDLKSEMLMLV